MGNLSRLTCVYNIAFMENYTVLGAFQDMDMIAPSLNQGVSVASFHIFKNNGFSALFVEGKQRDGVRKLPMHDVESC